MELGLLDILKLFGLDPGLPSRLVRHQSADHPAEVLRRNNWLDLYLAYQGRPVFRGVEQVVSFYGLGGMRAAFHGVFSVRGHRPAGKGPVLPSCEWSRRWNRVCTIFYDISRDSRFDSLCDRLIIDWGKGTRSWVQKLSNKPVIEIQEPGRQLPPFEDYLEFTLSYDELRALFDNEEAHKDWRASLSAVGGIYLILAEGCGALYVGSAFGTEGIWGRWRSYAATGDGGNKKLRALLRSDPGYPARFRFSVLQVLPKSMTREEVLKRETRYKQKLGTRAIGLNMN